MSMSMEESYHRDYAHKASCDALRGEIEKFLAERDDYGMGRPLRATLTEAVVQLQKQSDHIVKVWD